MTAARSAWILPLLLAACTPKDGATDLCVPAGEVVAHVPLWTDGCTLLVDVGLNGHEEKLVLDTGARWTTIADGTAREIGADPVGAVRVVRGGGGDLLMAGPAYVSRLSLANGTMGDALVDVARPTPWLSPAFKGALGNDLLQNWDVDLDLPDGLLAFERPQTCQRPRAAWPGDAVAVAMEGGGNDVAFPVSIDGVRGTAILDSGATVTTLAGKRRAAVPDVEAGVMEYGYEAVFEAHPHPIHHLVVADRDLGDLPALQAEGWEEPGTLLGLDFLARHRVLISYRSRTLFIEPRALPPSREFAVTADGVPACHAP